MFLEPIFEGQRKELAMMPRTPFGRKAKDMKTMAEHETAYLTWRKEKDQKRLQQQHEQQ